MAPSVGRLPLNSHSSQGRGVLGSGSVSGSTLGLESAWGETLSLCPSLPTSRRINKYICKKVYLVTVRSNKAPGPESPCETLWSCSEADEAPGPRCPMR